MTTERTTETGDKKLVHKIGCTRSIQTAVLVVQYLKERHARPHSEIGAESIRYCFTEPTDRNGWWSADIVVDSYDSLRDDQALSEMVNTCRAFVAGRGEIWA
jgi:hypothetical protein